MKNPQTAAALAISVTSAIGGAIFLWERHQDKIVSLDDGTTEVARGGEGELLVRGASKLAQLFGIPQLIVGLTVVAFCTSAPELAEWWQQLDDPVLDQLIELGIEVRDTAEGETGHAHGHLDFLKKAGDPATDLPIGDTHNNLKAAIAGETHEYTDMYPGMAKAAREEGFADIADWFETLAKAEKSHAGKFENMLKSIS